MEQLPASAEIIVWAWTALAVVVLGYCLARRGVRLAGPARVQPPANLGNLLILFFIVAGVWIGIPSLYGTVRRVTLSTTELVGLGAAANLAGILVFAIGNSAMRRGGMGGLRLAAGGMGRGVGWGVVGLILIEPLIFWSGVLTEWVYQKYQISHPSAHEMLNLLGSSHSPAMRILIVATAVVLAPIFEEILFRGLLQTLISQGRTAEPVIPPPPPIPVDMPPGDGPPVLEYASQAVALAKPTPGRAWLAIGVTALLFAAVHEPWTMPPIFVLAVCLGYAYERTGNLWTCITMHALFNLVSVLQYQWLMMR